MDDLISREEAKKTLKMLIPGLKWSAIDWMVDGIPSEQPEIIRCRDCEYGEQDEVGRWFCISLGCQIGNEDGSGFCADAERREDG
ncbi:MAG: hypothetical protein IKI87_00980 [Clostridiales bacterium]|nr:hypothetical protein [Clostridiales bacterium]